MLISQTTASPIAVRMYENKTYGTTYGKGLYRKALYNATAEVMAAGVTYLLDFYDYFHWSNMARSDSDMEVLQEIPEKANTLYSWVQIYDRSNKQKYRVPGVCTFDLDVDELSLGICDSQHSVEESWKLAVRRCKLARQDTNSPQLLATNTDLASA